MALIYLCTFFYRSKKNRALKNSHKHRLSIAGLLAMLYVLSGCLISTHHFRKGELLKSGESEVNWGFSYTEFKTCEDTTYKDGKGFTRCAGAWKDNPWATLSRSWRLGIRDSWGPFQGVEMGYYFETNSALEFDLRLGLPIPEWYPFKGIHHAVGMGWSIGFFPDNTYFIDYAISKRFNHHTIYANFRESLLSTQLVDTEQEKDPEDAGDLFKHRQRFVHQMGLGMEVRMPAIFLFPDQLHIQFLLTAPEIAMIGQPRPDFEVQPQINFGLGWHY